ncbi:GNAT family N-acetyltransferase [Streptomyces sp. SL13]|jgi:GNAT superfamily N-acetyltransferase|uniref:GNAT family N-acetyltransferase n=1 Tax=Streptantibioticus silvisoli TaxID=2705255 RepID=A0AA90KGS2_9ACTN|nr:GNAT family N-acetyltransferase [Streptantibioticus silvisoli]MDI5970905.1 GNAT family N-acetyltransferase [Streptantibioticus silvisoli]
MIRPVIAEDLALLHTLMLGMAEYEKATEQVCTDKEELRDALFGPAPVAFAHFAVDDETGQVIGYTLWSLVYSSWRGTAIHIDDIHVKPEWAGRGYDTALMSELAGLAVERGYRHMQWWATDGNKPAIDFYDSLGAERPSVRGHDLIILRLTGKPLTDLGSKG